MHDDFTVWTPSNQRKPGWLDCGCCADAPHREVIMQEVDEIYAAGGVSELSSERPPVQQVWTALSSRHRLSVVVCLTAMNGAFPWALVPIPCGYRVDSSVPVETVCKWRSRPTWFRRWLMIEGSKTTLMWCILVVLYSLVFEVGKPKRYP